MKVHLEIFLKLIVQIKTSEENVKQSMLSIFNWNLRQSNKTPEIVFSVFMQNCTDRLYSSTVQGRDLYIFRPVLRLVLTIDVFIYAISKENADLPMFLEQVKANGITVEDRSNCRWNLKFVIPYPDFTFSRFLSGQSPVPYFQIPRGGNEAVGKYTDTRLDKCGQQT